MPSNADCKLRVVQLFGYSKLLRCAVLDATITSSVSEANGSHRGAVGHIPPWTNRRGLIWSCRIHGQSVAAFCVTLKYLANMNIILSLGPWARKHLLSRR